MLQQAIEEKVLELRKRTRGAIANHGEEQIGIVTVRSALQGMRGVRVLPAYTSFVYPYQGVHLAGQPLSVVADRQHPAEDMLPFLITGSWPTRAQRKELNGRFHANREIPTLAQDVLKTMAPAADPMDMLCAGLRIMSHESHFTKAYREGGLAKEDHWKPTLDDGIRILGVAPQLVAYIHSLKFGDGHLPESRPELGYARNLAQMLGVSGNGTPSQFEDYLKLFIKLHCDHDSGNASAHTTLLVNSTLANLYQSCSAGMSALAGPLHGYANVDTLKLLEKILADCDGKVPTKEKLREILSLIKILAGFGHAVLAVPDPRFTALGQFGEKVCSNYPLYQLMRLTAEVGHEVLAERGNVRDPWPNVDLGSGVVLHYFGLNPAFYTVLFGISRLFGVIAQCILMRGINAPIERPDAVTLEQLENPALR